MTDWRFSPRALRDVDDIWNYTATRWSIEQAETYIRQIAHACQRLADSDYPCRDADDVRAGYFRSNVASHVLFFKRPAKRALVIVRVLHQRMDPARHL